MQAWIIFWKYFCIIGIILFYILVVFILPLGIKDLISLFRDLSHTSSNNKLSELKEGHGEEKAQC